MPWTAETLLRIIAGAAPDECIDDARLAELSGLTAKQIEHAAGKLRRHGFITRTGRGCNRLTAAGREAAALDRKIRSGPNGPHTGARQGPRGLRQRGWNALRMGKKLTLDDILMRAVEGDERDPRSNLLKYVRALARAGYVQIMPLRETPLNPTSNGCHRYLLISDTGPEAPVWRPHRDTVWDPNLEREIALAREVDA